MLIKIYLDGKKQKEDNYNYATIEEICKEFITDGYYNITVMNNSNQEMYKIYFYKYYWYRPTTFLMSAHIEKCNKLIIYDDSSSFLKIYITKVTPFNLYSITINDSNENQILDKKYIVISKNKINPEIECKNILSGYKYQYLDHEIKKEGIIYLTIKVNITGTKCCYIL